MLDGVAGALPGDAEVFPDLAEGEVVVVVLGHHLPLLVGEHLAVKVQQVAHLQIL